MSFNNLTRLLEVGWDFESGFQEFADTFENSQRLGSIVSWVIMILAVRLASF